MLMLFLPLTAHPGDLSTETTGCLIANGPIGALYRFSAAEAWTPQVVRKPSREGYAIAQISGPDENGMIAFLTSELGTGLLRGFKSRIVTANMRPFRELSQSDLFDEHVNRIISLAPKGGVIAVFQPKKSVAMGVIWGGMAGEIALYDFRTRNLTNTGVPAINYPLSWFPCGRRLAYTHELESGIADRLAQVDKKFRESAGKAQGPCGVSIYDLDSSKTTFLTWGCGPVVSSSGTSILLDRPNRPIRFSLKSGQVDMAQSAEGPASYSVLALIKDRYAIHRNRDRTVSVTDLITRDSSLLLTDIDQRASLSYGMEKD